MKIKNTLSIIALIAIVFFGCKKENRTCSCSVTRTGTSTTTAKVSQVLGGFQFDLADTSFVKNITDIQTIDKVLIDVTKKSAKGNCISYTQPYNETVLTSVPAASFEMAITVVNKGEEKFDCKLK